MEENKDFNPQEETEKENIPEIPENSDAETEEMEENFDILDAQKENKKPGKAVSRKPKKDKLIRNQALLKKGSYSVALTAIVLVGVVVFNILVGALSNRFVLEFDMTAEKENSISAENIDFIKGIKQEVEVTVCASEDAYSSFVGQSAEQLYSVALDNESAQYYDQTIKLVNKYNEYNKKIKVNFVDTQSTEFTAIASKYANDNLAYGDIIVSSKGANSKERYKKIGYEDIYALEQDQSSAYMGVSAAKISGNDIETALTGAISYAVSTIESKVALFTGHSMADYTASYKKLLENNNYQVTVVPDTLISEISDDYDIIVLAGPAKDFIESEISVLSKFLDNDGKMGKGMIVFADAAAPYLPNLFGLLREWGVSVQDGILFETDTSNHLPDDPTTLGSYNAGADSSLDDLKLCISGYNVPMTVAFEKQDYLRVASIIETTGTTVAAPKGISASWTGAGSYDKGKFATVIEAIKSSYDEDNEEIESRVAVFSSIHFLESEYNESASLSNKDITLAMVERAAGENDSGITFIAKSITNQSFAESVSQSSANLMRIIFMFVLPILVLVAGIIIYIKRRNA